MKNKPQKSFAYEYRAKGHCIKYPELRAKGHWIEYPELSDACFDYYQCSECKRVIKVVRGGSLSQFPFCHCGADMRGEQSNE